MPNSQYSGVVEVDFGGGVLTRLPFISCSLRRVDQYNTSQPITQRGPQNYTLGQQKFEGGLTVPLYDNVFLYLITHWILSQLSAGVAVTYHSGLSHLYYGVKVKTAQLSVQPGGLVTISYDLEGLYRTVQSTAYSAAISSISSTIAIPWHRTTMSGGGIVAADISGFNLSFDTGLKEEWTNTSQYYSPVDNSAAWYRRPYALYSGGLTTTGDIRFLNLQNSLVNGNQVTVTLGSNSLYLTRVVWNASEFPIAGPNAWLSNNIGFQSFGSIYYKSAHI